MEKVLIVVDMQNDYLLDSGSYNLGHDTSDFRKEAADFIKNFDGRIYLTHDDHSITDCEFENFPRHCVRYTHGHQLIDEIREVIKGKTFITLAKKSFTGASITNLANELADNDIKEIHIIGIRTHTSVHDIVANIVNHTKNRHNYHPNIILHNRLLDDSNMTKAKEAIDRMCLLYRARLESN